MSFLETLRKWPVIPINHRKCTADYNIPDSPHTIERGTRIFIPTYSYHHDPEYYPNPEEFNPDRFKSIPGQKKDDSLYLPFGGGPRICIGVRFAEMQVKTILSMLIANYEFTLNEKMKHSHQYAKHFVGLHFRELWLNVKPRKR